MKHKEILSPSNLNTANDVKAGMEEGAQLPALLADTIAPDSPSRFINREISWLSFNNRVLNEAQNSAYPLLERLRFLSISASNLDEFYMVRVAGLKGQVGAGHTNASQDGMSPMEQLHAVQSQAMDLMQAQQRVYEDLLVAMAKKGIKLLQTDKLTIKDRKWLDQYFINEIFPTLTPLAIDPSHPFPFIPNFGFALVLSLRHPLGGSIMHGLVLMPAKLRRFIRLPGTQSRFLPLEEVFLLYLDHLFPGFTLRDYGFFRVIRDSDLEVEEEAEDLVHVFKSALKRRRRGSIIRLKVSGDMSRKLLDLVSRELAVNRAEIIKVNGILGMADVKQLIDSKTHPDLVFPPYSARFPERIRDFGGQCLAAIGAKDIIIHHPFESFDVVVQFLKEAAEDPDVVAIKQTLYRTSNDSEIIKYLVVAAEAGKSVTAMVELKARFDEEANLRWAADLERAGCHVVYGFLDLKTHAKVSMVMRREPHGLRTYVHLGTGNYHPITAKIYTDLSYFTCDPALGRDAAKLFNYMTGYARPQKLEKLSYSPHNIKRDIIKFVEREIDFAQRGKPAEIWLKANSLADQEIIDSFYKAAQAGVKIELVIRGICSLRPGVPGLSENIRVKSIVGRFLEHSRIICFGNGHTMPSRHAQVFISSADMMSRNLNRRVETMVPIENPTAHQQVLDQIMVANLKDCKQSWLLQSDGTYRRSDIAENDFSCHDYFMNNPSLSGRGKAVINGTRSVPALSW